MEFYGLVHTANGDLFKPFFKTESIEDAREVKGDNPDVAIIKYNGFKREAHRRTTLVIKDVVRK